MVHYCSFERCKVRLKERQAKFCVDHEKFLLSQHNENRVDSEISPEDSEKLLSLFAHRNGYKIEFRYCCQWEFEECNKRPLYGRRGSIKRFCGFHRDDNMVHFYLPLCHVESCSVNASYNIKGERPIACHIHRDSNMVRIYSNMCSVSTCNSEAFYSTPGTRPTVCPKHKVDGMIRNPLRKCLLCKEFAAYGENGRQVHCELHRLPHEINYVEHPCKSCRLVFRLNPTLLCDYCDPSVASFVKTKQNNLMTALDFVGLYGNSTDITIDHGMCGKERPDRLFLLLDKAIVLECDEFQHRHIDPSCENARMFNISQSLGGLPVYFIRWNPDNYTSSLPIASIDQRYSLLINTLSAIMEGSLHLPSAFLSVLYLFYDSHLIPFDSLPNLSNWKILTPFHKV